MGIILACVVAILFNSAVLAQENQEDRTTIQQTSATSTEQALGGRKTQPNLPRWFFIAPPFEEWCTAGAWCVQPKILTATEEMQFAMRWAKVPAERVLDAASPWQLVTKAKQFDGSDGQKRSSTVGQGN